MLYLRSLALSDIHFELRRCCIRAIDSDSTIAASIKARWLQFYICYGWNVDLIFAHPWPTSASVLNHHKHTLTKARRIPHHLDVTVCQLIGNMRVAESRFQKAPFCPRFQNFMPVCNSRSNSVLLNLLQDQCTVSNFGDTNLYQIFSKTKNMSACGQLLPTHLVSFVNAFPVILFSMNFLA